MKGYCVYIYILRILLFVSQKRFKRLRRIEDEESEEEVQKEADEERDAIANELFEGSGDVSATKMYHIVSLCVQMLYNLHRLPLCSYLYINIIY